MPAKNRDLHGSAPDESHAALLLIDVINHFDYPGGRALSRHALPMARRVAPTTRPSDAVVQSARGLIASALDGSARPGCIRMHFAALTLATDSTGNEPAPLP